MPNSNPLKDLASSSVSCARSSLAAGQIARQLAEQLLSAQERLSHADSVFLYETVKTLLRSTIKDVRLALAKSLAAEPRAPHALVVFLAEDDIDIAHPLLALSPILQDADLLAIIEGCGVDHQRHIAKRACLGVTITDRLVQIGDGVTVETLLENRSAALSAQALHTLTAQARYGPTWQGALLARPEMAPSLAVRLYFYVCAQWRSYIITRFSPDPRLLQRNIDDLLVNMAWHCRDYRQDISERHLEAPALHLACELAATQKIDGELLVQLLRQGQDAVFQILLARLFDITPEAVHKLLHERATAQLACACQHVGIVKQHFAAIFLLSRRVRPGEQIVDPHELKQALSAYDSPPQHDGEECLRWLRASSANGEGFGAYMRQLDLQQGYLFH
jgi:uncharacterized protein (DUF2336 family)